VTHARLKGAELTSSIGAGVLGAGLALLVAHRLATQAIPILLVGLLMHVRGTFDKHRLEGRAGAPPLWWARLLWWGCCVGVLLMVVHFIVGS
jgi:uncharacterized membrane protein YozB (DUF420 family)